MLGLLSSVVTGNVLASEVIEPPPGDKLTVHFESGLPYIEQRAAAASPPSPVNEVIVETDNSSEVAFTLGNDGYFVRPGSRLILWTTNAGVQRISLERGGVLAMTQNNPLRPVLHLNTSRSNINAFPGVIYVEVLKAKDYVCLSSGRARVRAFNDADSEVLHVSDGHEARHLYGEHSGDQLIREVSRRRHSDQEVAILLNALDQSHWHRRISNDIGRPRRQLF